MINTVIFDIGMVLVYFRWRELFADLGFEGEKFEKIAKATVHNPWWNEFDKGKMTVEEIVDNGKQIAILDTSAACHMPDVIEMPYRPPLLDSGEAGEKKYTYTLGGPTCLAGDVIGEYSFNEPLRVGDRLVFGDMAIYSMVKNNTFNGMALPDIVALHEDGSVKVVKRFGYEDFKSRL